MAQGTFNSETQHFSWCILYAFQEAADKFCSSIEKSTKQERGKVPLQFDTAVLCESALGLAKLSDARINLLLYVFNMREQRKTKQKIKLVRKENKKIAIAFNNAAWALALLTKDSGNSPQLNALTETCEARTRLLRFMKEHTALRPVAKK